MDLGDLLLGMFMGALFVGAALVGWRLLVERQHAAASNAARGEATPSDAVQRSRVTKVLVGVLLALLVGPVLILLYYSGRPRAAVEYRQGSLELEWMYAIDGPGAGEMPRFDGPLGVALAANGDLFVADSGNNRVCVFDRDGAFVREWGGFGIAKPAAGVSATWKPGLFNYPVGIEVGDDRLVYVADFRNDQISVFSQEGEFVRAFPDPLKVVGRGGSGQDGTGIAVTDVAVRDGYVYATDTYQVFVFTPDGAFVRQFGKPGSGLSDLYHPAGLAAGVDSLYVADSNHQRVTAFNSFDQPTWSTATWIDDTAEGTGKTGFGLPRGLTRTAEGLIVVADAVGQSLIVMDENGSVLASLGERGTVPGRFNFPADVASLGDVLAVADKANDRVQLFALKGGTRTE